MRGRAWKKWFKNLRPSKDDVRDVKADLHWMKPVDRALKFAKKALNEMKKGDPVSGCGLWYDISDGFGYREMCRAGGRCYGDQDSGCPYMHAKMLIKMLGGHCE